MTESTLISKFLNREYPDDHQVIYLYCCGNVRSPKTAVNRVFSLVNEIFSPIPKEILEKNVLSFLDMKKNQYRCGEIKIKPIY